MTPNSVTSSATEPLNIRRYQDRPIKTVVEIVIKIKIAKKYFKNRKRGNAQPKHNKGIFPHFQILHSQPKIVPENTQSS